MNTTDQDNASHDTASHDNENHDTGDRQAWERILEVRMATEGNLLELQRTLAYCFFNGDPGLTSDLTPATAALHRALAKLDDYLVHIHKAPNGQGTDSDVSTGTTDVPERDSGDGGGTGSGTG